MSTQRRWMGRGVAATVLVLAILSTCPGCDGRGSASRSDGVQQREADRFRDTDVQVENPARTGPRPCPSQSWSTWTIQDRTTRDVAYGRIGDLVVAPQGTATLAWSISSSRSWNVLTSDQPSPPGDPQVLPGPPPDPVPDGAEVSAMFPTGDHLGVDNSGALTATWYQDLRLRSGQNTEYYDLVLSDRAAGGAWSAMPHVAGDGSVYGSGLAVNASGAAVVAWDRYNGDEFPSYVSYRPAAGAAWTPAERVAPHAGSLRDVGIDDAGRVVLLYSTRREQVMAVRGTPITGWSRPHPLPGGDMTLAVSTGGAAVVAGRRWKYGRRPYTIRMSRSGTWGAPVRQPDAGYPGPTVAMDGAGRALYVWWADQRLMTQWSGPSGRWRKPCVVAEDVPDPRYFDDVDSHVAVNRHGDALLVWRTKDPTPHLWARYKPAEQSWTEPIEVTAGATRLPGEFRAAIGARGDAAIAWMSLNFRQLNVLRMSPSRRPGRPLP